VIVFAAGDKARRGRSGRRGRGRFDDLVARIQEGCWTSIAGRSPPGPDGQIGRIARRSWARAVLMPKPEERERSTMDVTKAVNEIKGGKITFPGGQALEPGT